ncbi:uncharacterized protein JCM15063_004067 [Sporobolomyces koalae]|uniref:uncharacterized protein n=1 Tax=Sporobolomyces koalae TaxID=500713 RepID=UPI0031783AFE
MNSKKPPSKSKKAPVSSTSSTTSTSTSLPPPKKRTSSAQPPDEHKRAKRTAVTTGKKSLREEELGVGGEIEIDDDEEDPDDIDSSNLARESHQLHMPQEEPAGIVRAPDEDDLDEDDEEGGDGGITRCVCGDDNEEMSSGLMIQCDTCKCWQHGPCVGLWEEKECPNRYFCELCKPNLHGPGGLLRKVSRGKSAAASASVPARRTRSPSLSKPTQASHSPPPPPVAAKSQSTGVAAVGPPAKKRSTMNSRDAAYDDAIALSILEAGGAARRDKLEGRDRDSESDSEGDSDRDLVDRKDKKARAKSGSASAGLGTAAGKGAGKKASGLPGTKGQVPLLEKLLSDSSSTLVVPKVEPFLEHDHVAAESKSSRARNISPELGGPGEQTSEIANLKATESGPVVEHEYTGEDQVMQDVEHVDEAASETARDHGAPEISPQTSTSALPSVPSGSSSAKGKHPNQYTYRAKNGPAATTSTGARNPRASPTKRAHQTDSTNGSVAPTAAAAVTKANAKGKDKAIPAALVLGEKDRERLQWASELGIHLGWAMPEHLKHLAHLLPSAIPEPIHVPTPTSTSAACTSNPYNVYPEHSEQFDPNRASSASDGGNLTHFEPPTKVRFPGKRVTMPEMRKRVKTMVEYLDKVRQELAGREKKDEVLRRAIEANRSRTSVYPNANANGSEAGTPTQGTTGLGTSGISENTLSYLESLGRELVMFQQRFDS